MSGSFSAFQRNSSKCHYKPLWEVKRWYNIERNEDKINPISKPNSPVTVPENAFALDDTDAGFMTKQAIFDWR